MPLIHLHNGPLDGQTIEVTLVPGVRVTELLIVTDHGDHQPPVFYECDDGLEEGAGNPLDDRFLFYQPDNSRVQEFVDGLSS